MARTYVSMYITLMNKKLDQILKSLEALGKRITSVEVKLHKTTEKFGLQNQETEELKSALFYLEKEQTESQTNIMSITTSNHLHMSS